MAYFDACEACGQTEHLVLGGLCFTCQRKADRAANGPSTLPRDHTLVFENYRVLTSLATGRPVPRDE